MVVSGKKKTSRYLVGDRFRGPMGEGTLTLVRKKGLFPYEITWWNGHAGLYSAEQIERYGYQLLPPDPGSEDIEEEELNLWEQFGEEGFSREQNIELEILALIQSGIGDTTNLAAKSSLSMLAIAPVLKNLETQGKIERKNYLWWPKCSDNLTSAPVLVSDSPLQDLKSEGLPLLDYAKLTTTAEISSPSDIQAFQSSETSSDTTGEPLEESTSLQLPLLASLSVSRENDSPPTTQETVSPTSSKRSPKSSRRTSRSKTSKDCSVAPIGPVGGKEPTSTKLDVTFTNWSSDLSGELLVQDILERPSLESGCSWLESPNGLSAVGRSPGQSRLEAQLKSEQHLQDGQTINPAFLEDAFEIPLGWTDPSELRPATELLGGKEKRSVTALTPESPPLPSAEYSTLTESESLKTEEELTPVDESAVGRHYWCDRLDVTVTVETIHPWRVTPRAKELTKAARCRPWWGKFPDVIVIQLDELVEVEELSCPLPTQTPEIPITGISQDSHPVTENGDSLGKLDFPFKQGDIITCNYYPDRELEVTEELDFPGRMGVKFLDGGRGGKTFYTDKVVCHLLREGKKSLEKSETHTTNTKQVGSLYQYTANKADKAGNISTYPKVEGDRSREEDAHWYWGFSYVEKQNGKWRDKSAAVPRKKLPEVREALRAGKNYTYILQQVLGKD